jgi:hypothetical protein
VLLCRTLAGAASQVRVLRFRIYDDEAVLYISASGILHVLARVQSTAVPRTFTREYVVFSGFCPKVSTKICLKCFWNPVKDGCARQSFSRLRWECAVKKNYSKCKNLTLNFRVCYFTSLVSFFAVALRVPPRKWQYYGLVWGGSTVAPQVILHVVLARVRSTAMSRPREYSKPRLWESGTVFSAFGAMGWIWISEGFENETIVETVVEKTVKRCSLIVVKKVSISKCSRAKSPA